MIEDELNDLLALCHTENIDETTGEYAVWINITGSD